jgi:hypothetical protein
MMRLAPAAKAFAFATSRPANRNVAFTALRMMSSAAPSIKVRHNIHDDGRSSSESQRLEMND